LAGTNLDLGRTREMAYIAGYSGLAIPYEAVALTRLSYAAPWSSRHFRGRVFSGQGWAGWARPTTRRATPAKRIRQFKQRLDAGDRKDQLL